MFTGIVEALATVKRIEREGSNVHFSFESELSKGFKIDQSVAHNGVCLTVVEVWDGCHKVTAIEETMQKSNLSLLKVGDVVNLERCMALGARLDGHIVQGHVDQTGTCIERKELDGSWLFRFEYDASQKNLTVEKGSICVNGVSLTVFDSQRGGFSVAIIPYTFENTTFSKINVGSKVNLEFDIIGKYVQELYRRQEN